MSNPRRAPRATVETLGTEVLAQVHREMQLSAGAAAWLVASHHDLARRLVADGVVLEQSAKRRTVSSRSIQTAVRFNLPGELAKHAVSEGTKAVCKACAAGSSGCAYNSSGLTLTHAAARALLKEHTTMRVGSGAYVYLSAVVEYICAEILELGGNACRNEAKAAADTAADAPLVVRRLHLMAGILGDEELCRMYGAPQMSWMADAEGNFLPRPLLLDAVEVGVEPATEVRIHHKPSINRLSTQRLIREIAQNFKYDLRFATPALALLHAAIEGFILELFATAATIACERGTATITPKVFRAAVSAVWPTTSDITAYHLVNNPFLGPIDAAIARREHGALHK